MLIDIKKKNIASILLVQEKDKITPLLFGVKNEYFSLRFGQSMGTAYMPKRFASSDDVSEPTCNRKQ